jgi:phosphatidylinositol alpha-1,6-mannosyltransferase
MEAGLKALLITLEYPPQVGGVANYYSALVHAQVFDCAVATREDLPAHWLKAIPWLYRQIKQHHYSHILVGQVLPLGTVAWLVSRFTGTPYVVFTHGMDVLVPQQSARKRWLLHRILRKAQRVIAASEFTANQVRQFDPKVQHVTVIHPAASITPHTPAQQPAAQLPEQFVLSVGRLVERKGFDYCIQALAGIPNLHYVIAGNGDDRERLMQLAKDHGVQERVHILHNLSNGELAYLYQHCLYLLLPSRQLANGDVEGYGIVVVEANRFGKTAIGGKAGGMEDAIQDGVTGLLVNPTDLQAIQGAMQRLLTDTADRQRLEQQALAWSQTQTWQHCAEQLKAVLK